MSYSGDEEYLCENGHYNRFNCYESGSAYRRCRCGSKLIWYHPVDLTNGYDFLDKTFATCEAPLKKVGEDQFGLVYKPLGKNIWHRFNNKSIAAEKHEKVKPMRITLKNSRISYEIADDKVENVYFENTAIKNLTKSVLIAIVFELISILLEVKAEKQAEPSSFTTYLRKGALEFKSVLKSFKF